ncbi:hypothetical protein PHMEG_0004709 [Phytophthora megakarya]|uniref:RxLR effector protein n=1 Tax=Phytophthora megakarya TaxID=4795 RepID=A0A225WT76_9STRA|nr:hypothetical protein PHMEG_0004709 [Phytophthora megakarya]
MSKHAAETPSKALRALHEDNNNGLRIHEPVDEDTGDNKEERGGGVNKFLNKFRYQSKSAHGAEDLNQVAMARNYLQENPALFEAIRGNYAKRYEMYSIWRGMEYHSDEAGWAMKDYGFSSKDVKKFVQEYKDFQPERLSFT